MHTTAVDVKKKTKKSKTHCFHFIHPLCFPSATFLVVAEDFLTTNKQNFVSFSKNKDNVTTNTSYAFSFFFSNNSFFFFSPQRCVLCRCLFLSPPPFHFVFSLGKKKTNVESFSAPKRKKMKERSPFFFLGFSFWCFVVPSFLLFACSPSFLPCFTLRFFGNNDHTERNSVFLSLICYFFPPFEGPFLCISEGKRHSSWFFIKENETIEKNVIQKKKNWTKKRELKNKISNQNKTSHQESESERERERVFNEKNPNKGPPSHKTTWRTSLTETSWKKRIRCYDTGSTFFAQKNDCQFLTFYFFVCVCVLVPKTLFEDKEHNGVPILNFSGKKEIEQRELCFIFVCSCRQPLTLPLSFLRLGRRGCGYGISTFFFMVNLTETSNRFFFFFSPLCFCLSNKETFSRSGYCASRLGVEREKAASVVGKGTDPFSFSLCVNKVRCEEL